LQISAQTQTIVNKKIKFTTIEDISEVKTGIGTGDNKYYLYKIPEETGDYKKIDMSKVLKNEEIQKIKNDEKLRLSIISNGINPKLFGGRTILPLDKGGSSDIESGRLSNYFTFPGFFIDYSKKNVERIKTLTIADRKRHYGEKNILKSDEGNVASRFQNIEYNFKDGITFSKAGIYTPLFRVSTGAIFNDGGNCLFVYEKYQSFFTIPYLLGILCSKLQKYLLKTFVNNSINIQVDDVKKSPIPICEKSQKQKIENLVKEIIKKQKKDPDYNYQDHEQIEIDNLVYEIFGLDQELIDEVETWYARRYPKLVRN